MTESYMEIVDGKAVVHIVGVAGIDSANHLYQLFQDAVNSHYPVVLDMEHGNGFDSTFVQLVRSLCYTLNRGGHVPLQITQKQLPAELNELVMNTGIQFPKTCTRVNGIECAFHAFEPQSGHVQEAF